MKIREIKDFLNTLYPFENKCEWDNCGLLVGNEENEVKNRLAKKDAQIAELATKIQSFKDQQTQALAEQQQAMFSGDLMKVQMYPPYIQSLKKSEDFYTEAHKTIFEAMQNGIPVLSTAKAACQDNGRIR